MGTSNEELKEMLSKVCSKDSRLEGVKVVDLDDTIKFNCKRCGKCCCNRSDIIINPFDVYKIAKALNISAKDVIENYTEVYAGSNSGLPIVVIKDDERGMCPFLKFSITEGLFGCSINDSKPGACIMHPIGVMRSKNIDTGEKEVNFIEVPSCSEHGEDVEIKVRDFIKPYLDHEEEHEIGMELQFEANKYIQPNKLIKGLLDKDEEILNTLFTEEERESAKGMPKGLEDRFYQVYLNVMIKSLYDMDMSKDFMEQVDTIKEHVKAACFLLCATFRVVNIDIAAKDLSEEDEKVIENFSDDIGKELEFIKELLEGEED